MGYRLKKEMEPFMNKLRRQKEWNKYDPKWCKEAGVSESTLKRFWGAIDGGVSEQTLMAICKAAGLEDVAEKWDDLAEEVNKDSTCPRELKSPDDIEIVNSSTELDSKTNSIPTACDFHIRIASPVGLTLAQKDLVEDILEDLKEHIINIYTSLVPKSNQTTSLETHKYNYRLTISGFVTIENKWIVDDICDELKHHTGIDDSSIKWKSKVEANKEIGV